MGRTGKRKRHDSRWWRFMYANFERETEEGHGQCYTVADVWRSVKPHRCGIADVAARSERATGVRIESASRRRSRHLKAVTTHRLARRGDIGGLKSQHASGAETFHFTNSSFFYPHVPSIGPVCERNGSSAAHLLLCYWDAAHRCSALQNARTANALDATHGSRGLEAYEPFRNDAHLKPLRF